VVTEIRGDQDPNDTLGEWIEIYNASGGPVEMTGLRMDLRSLDGSKSARIDVRSPGLTLPARGYFVIGNSLPGEEPTYVDFGWGLSLTGSLYGAAVLELRGCGELIDEVLWRNLPTTGSLQLSGSATPNATTNDQESAFCQSADPAGTPQQENPSCP